MAGTRSSSTRPRRPAVQFSNCDFSIEGSSPTKGHGQAAGRGPRSSRRHRVQRHAPWTPAVARGTPSPADPTPVVVVRHLTLVRSRI